MREALQFPWPGILQQNLEAAARSEGKREAARRAASRASRAAAAEKKRRLQRLQCEKECEVEIVKSRFFFSFFFFCFRKRELSRQMRTFRVVLHFLIFVLLVKKDSNFEGRCTKGQLLALQL